MKFLDRLMTFLLSLLIIVAGIACVYIAFEKEQVLSALTVLMTSNRSILWSFLLVGVVLIVIGVIVMLCIAFRRTHKAEPHAVKAESQDGNIELTHGAIDAMVREAVKGVAGITSIEVVLQDSNNGLVVQAKITVGGDVNIVAICDQVKVSIRTCLETMGGLKVADVKVLVTEVTINKAI